MTLGIGSHTFPWAFGIPGYPAPPDPMTPAHLIDFAAARGVHVVQLADNAPVSALSREHLATVAKHAGDSGVTLELGTRGTIPELLAKDIELASRCGARILRSVPTLAIPIGDRKGNDRALQTIIDDLRSVVTAFEDSGIILCLENYEGMSVHALAEVIRRVDSSHVRVCLDTVNSLGRGEGITSVLDALAPLTANLHVKDYTVRRQRHRLGFTIEGAPACEGELLIKELFNRVPQSVTAVVELWTPWQGSIEQTMSREREWAERSIQNLRECVCE